MNHWTTIDISLRSILKVIGVLLALWFLYHTRDIVLLLFLVVIIVMALDPIVGRWQQRMPRAVAVGLLFVILIATITGMVSLLFPPLIGQIGDLASSLPSYAQQLESVSSSFRARADLDLTQRLLNGISEQLSNISRGFINTTLGILGGVFTFLTVMILSAYLLLEEKGIRNFFIALLPLTDKEHIIRAVNKVGDKLGAWLRGQLLLMIIIGISTMIWTSLLGLPYSLTLGLWAGLTEVIPYIGPILGGIPILLLAFVDSPLKALIALVLIVLTQQVESNFIVPKVMQRAVGLSPVIVIIALLIGGKLFGITGTILAVPLAATLYVILQEWPSLMPKSKNKEAS